jgi:predicted DNA-binding transcriptional regulator YafY
MKNLKPSALPAIPAPDTFDVRDYHTGVFYMYDGEEMIVELLCESKHMKSIVDRFGEKVETRIADPEHFIVTVTASVSPTFFAWVFQFCGEIKILSPRSAVDRYRKCAIHKGFRCHAGGISHMAFSCSFSHCKRMCVSV